SCSRRRAKRYTERIRGCRASAGAMSLPPRSASIISDTASPLSSSAGSSGNAKNRRSFCRIIALSTNHSDIGLAPGAKEFERVDKPAILGEPRRHPVAPVQYARQLRRIAQAVDDFRRELQFLGDLVPDRHQPHRARIVKTEAAGADTAVDQIGDLAPNSGNPRICPP